MRTKLQAVNSVLTDMGRSPVNQISTSQNPEASEISQLIDFETDKVLQKGWQFNSRYRVSLSVSASGECAVPSTALSLRISDHYTQTQGLPSLTVRNNKLYNLDDGDYDLSDFDSVLVDIIEDIPFEELPSTPQDYIIDKVAYEFAIKRVPDPELHERLRLAMGESYSLMTAEEVRNRRANMLTGNKSTHDIVNRRRNPVRRY